MTLVGHWPLDEDSGTTAYDYSGHDHHLSVAGATVNVAGPLGGSAYSFDGTDDYLSVGTPAISGSYTVTFWMKADAETGFPRFISDSNEMFEVYTEGDGELRAFWYSSSASARQYFESGGTMDLTYSANTWVHVACVYNADTNTNYSYKNGTQVASVGTSGSPPSPGTLNIGRESGGNYFAGDLANIRLYDRALTPAEIQYLYSVSQHATRMTSPQHR